MSGSVVCDSGEHHTGAQARQLLKEIVANESMVELMAYLKRHGHIQLWRMLRDAHILWIAENMQPVPNFWRAVATELERLTGCRMTPDACRKVDERYRSI